MGTWAVQADPRLSTPHRGQYFGACGKDKGCKKGDGKVWIRATQGKVRHMLCRAFPPDVVGGKF